ncbi:hypothetical protein REPUB_Repub09cG0172500 [Reevesia pubescens]
MTSHFRREDEQFMFTPKAPHFFKIVLENTLQDDKLGIPRKFVKKYGNAMSNQALLKVPSGKIWMVELSKCDGQIWFQKGWREFAEYYSLSRGHFLVFRYEGNCNFHVLIFDMSASEINYPYTKADDNQDSDSVSDQDFNVEEDEDDVSLEILEETAPCKKKREKPPIQCPRPQKMMKTNMTNKTEKILNSDILAPRFRPYGNKASGTKLEKLEGNTNSSCFRQEDGGLKPSKRAGRVMENEWESPHQAEILGFQLLTAKEKAKTLQIATAFNSNNPFFLVVIKPSNISQKYIMCIPSNFARKYFKKKKGGGEATLCLLNGKSWLIKYYRTVFDENPKAVLTSGWKKFAADNNLIVGDICLFELLKWSEITLKVAIHRVVDDTNCDLSQAPEATSRFDSNVQFFRRVVHPCHLTHGYVDVPFEFVKKHFKPETQYLTLQVSDRFWSVRILVYPSYRTAKLRAGWPKFARENSLKVGDVCVFELITSSVAKLNRIPTKFVRKYGSCLSISSVILIVPSGATWHVGLTKSDDNGVWLQHGWQEYAEHYSLKHGHLLVFKYEGNCNFQVLIFDKSATEIDYPCISHIEDDENDEECQEHNKEEGKAGTSAEIFLHEAPPSKKRREKSRSPCSEPRKKLRTTSKDKNKRDCEDVSSGEGDLQAKVPRERHAFGANEYDKILQRASDFTSENPFFMVTMQPSYINPGRKMCIPKDFTTKFLKNNSGDITLTMDGKTWSANYFRYVSVEKYTKAILYNGWREFMQDNKLEAGDLCVFELIEQTKILLKVVIYRVSEDSSSCFPLGGINSLANGSNGVSSTNKSTKSKHPCSMRPLTSHEKARAILKASNFKSKNPFFKVVMQPRYLTVRYSLSIPYKFVKKYLDEKKDQVILQVSDGRTWIVKFSVKIFTSGQHKAEFYHTWRAFAKDNNLEVGDVCIFELINRNETTFKVSIFPAAQNAKVSMSPQAEASRASQVASKNCLIPKREADDDFGNCYDGNSSRAAQFTTTGYQATKEKVEPIKSLPCPDQPCKMMIISNSTSNTRSNSSLEALALNARPDDTIFREIKFENPEENCKLHGSMKGFGASSTRPRDPQTKGTRRTQPLRAAEKAKALQRASGFKSQNPFFIVAMQPSYVCHGCGLAIPVDFSRNRLTKSVGEMILCMPNGKTWWTKYRREANETNPRARVIDGWKTFAEDNNLEVGDVCVFEMIKSNDYELSFNVVIYYAEEDERWLC